MIRSPSISYIKPKTTSELKAPPPEPRSALEILTDCRADILADLEKVLPDIRRRVESRLHKACLLIALYEQQKLNDELSKSNK